MTFYRILIYTFLLTSCSGYQYVASPPYVPLQTKRGQSDINVYLSSIQAGYAISNHFTCFATGFRRFNEDGGGKGNPIKKDNTERYRESDALEINIGAGYFNKIDNINYAMLIGGGAGRMNYINKRDYYDYDFRMKANTKNIYLQPTAGKFFNEHLELAVFAKLNFCNYSNISTSSALGVYLAPEVEDEFFIGRKQVDVWVLNPGVSFKAGWKFMKFHVQASPTIQLNNTVVREQLINLNVGLSFNPSLLRHLNDK